MDTDEPFLRRALDVCRAGMAAGQAPFGAVVVRDGVVIAESYNTVALDRDPTAHAEVNAIRAAAAALGTWKLDGCTLYTTCEPCPMCLAASHWAGIARVVFGAGIDDAVAAGFNQLAIPAAELIARGGSPLRLTGGVLRDDCSALLRGGKGPGGPPSRG